MGLFHVEVRSPRWQVAGGEAQWSEDRHGNAGDVLRLVLVCPLPWSWMSAFAHHSRSEAKAAGGCWRGLWPRRVSQEEHSGPQSAGAARWLCFIWPRRKFIFRCGLHTHTSGRNRNHRFAMRRGGSRCDGVVGPCARHLAPRRECASPMQVAQSRRSGPGTGSAVCICSGCTLSALR